MKCSKPFRKDGEEFGCGQCRACLVNKRRLWTSRLFLESCCHQAAWFVTLTYAPEHCPADASVSVRAAQDYLRKLRSIVAPRKVRYFIVGEYGDESERPHYHAIIFGNVTSDEVQQAWSLGHSRADAVTMERLQYLAGYTAKKWTRVNEWNKEKLAGRSPEFARMSLKPGIGAGAVEDLARVHHSRGGSLVVARTGDVSGSYRQGGALWPLGRYLRSRLRQEVIGVEKEMAVARDVRRRGIRDRLLDAGDFGASDVRKRLNQERSLEVKSRIFRKRKI